MFVFGCSLSVPYPFIKKGLSMIRINKQLLEICNKFSILSHSFWYQFSKWHQFEFFASRNLFANPFPFWKKPPFQSSSAFFPHLNLQSFCSNFYFCISPSKVWQIEEKYPTPLRWIRVRFHLYV